MYKIIGVQFYHPQRPSQFTNHTVYSYRVTEAQAARIEHGSHIVVDVPATGGLTVVRCVRPPQTPAEAGHIASRWIVDVVDLASYKEREQRTKRIAEIEEQLDGKLKTRDKLAQYADLANYDHAARDLLNELTKLNTA